MLASTDQSAPSVLFLTILVALGSLGCKDDQPKPTPPAPAADETRVTPPTPVVGGALEAYLAAFPFDRFEVVEIPDAGKFYVDDKGKGQTSVLFEGFRRADNVSFR